ncbi:MAG: hypothetical protein WA621_05530 [Candidatus Acidiferrum sp.]|jgi:hypothetical protein
MGTKTVQPLEEEFLVDSIRFFRRMGNYLFLPFFIVFGFCTAIMLVFNDGPWNLLLKSNMFFGYLTLAGAGLALWRLSRRPRSGMLFAVGLALAIIDLTWVCWLLYLIASGEWKTILFRVEYALAVLIGVSAASLKCFKLWSAFRQVDGVVLEAALRGVIEKNTTRQTAP